MCKPRKERRTWERYHILHDASHKFVLVIEQIIACASLFLGGKIEETPKALTDILRVVSTVRFAGQPVELQAAMVGTSILFDAALLPLT